MAPSGASAARTQTDSAQLEVSTEEGSPGGVQFNRDEGVFTTTEQGREEEAPNKLKFIGEVNFRGKL